MSAIEVLLAANVKRVSGFNEAAAKNRGRLGWRRSFQRPDGLLLRVPLR